jgi:hypothetical protein
MQDRIMCDRENQRGGPCPNDAVPGDSRCGFHGGREESRFARKRRTLAKRHAEGYVERKFGDPRWIDPGYALLEEVARSAGHVAFLEKRVNELEESQLVWNEVMDAWETKNGGGPTGDYTMRRQEARAEISKWWELYERERKHLATVSAAALKAGVEERRLRLAERAAEALDDMLGNLMRDFGYDPASPQVREMISHRLGELLASDWMGSSSADVGVQTHARELLPVEDDSPGPDPVQF